MSDAYQDMIRELVVLGRDRRTHIKSRVKVENMCRSRIMSLLGHDPLVTGKLEDAMRKRTTRIYDALYKGKKPHDEDVLICEHAESFVGALVPSVKTLSLLQVEIEKKMTEAAKRSPRRILEWLEEPAQKGFGLKGLAIILAACHGDNMNGFSDFPTYAKVWKRVGLGFAGVNRNGDKENDIQIRQMYKLTRADVYVFMYDQLIRHQWCGDVDEDGNKCSASKKPVVIPAHATGPRGEDYAMAKLKYMARVEATAHLPDKIGAPGEEKANPAKWTPKRADMAARRYVAKRLLRELWRVWREETTRVVPDEASRELSPLPEFIASASPQKRRRKTNGNVPAMATGEVSSATPLAKEDHRPRARKSANLRLSPSANPPRKRGRPPKPKEGMRASA